ncbi:kinase-like protein [Ceratobasidium sp. AG-I]|nr:kinase-like protein [Ceratobasidium sp. AG-I]
MDTSERNLTDIDVFSELDIIDSACIVCQIRNLACSNPNQCAECYEARIDCFGVTRPEWLTGPNARNQAANNIKRHLLTHPLGPTDFTPWLGFDHLIPIYAPRFTGLSSYGSSNSSGTEGYMLFDKPEPNRTTQYATGHYPTQPSDATAGAFTLPYEDTPPAYTPAPGHSGGVRRVLETVSSTMTAKEMFQCLLRHGCVDLSQSLDPGQYSVAALAGGSFGDIWQGRLLNGDKVAIKCLRFHVITEDSGKSLKRAAREMYSWSKANHGNVQTLIGIVMFQERLGMVSLWMEHGNLREYIQKNTGVDRYDLCMQVTSGVSYLHGIGMVHGDLKALNILVSQEGVAKISDFDHSILADCSLIFSATTNLGGGTMRWMAPELLLSSDEESNVSTTKSTQTDVYALGMTMLEIISGRVPYFEYKHESGIYRALDKKKAPTRPDEFPTTDEKANQIWALLLNCWDHTPSARPEALTILGLLYLFDTNTYDSFMYL